MAHRRAVKSESYVLYDRTTRHCAAPRTSVDVALYLTKNKVTKARGMFERK